MELDIESWRGRTFPSHSVDVTTDMIRQFALSIGETEMEEAPITFPVCLDLSRADPGDRLASMGVPQSCVLHAEQSISSMQPIRAGMRVSCATRISEVREKKEGSLILVSFVTEFTATQKLLSEIILTLAIRPAAERMP